MFLLREEAVARHISELQSSDNYNKSSLNRPTSASKIVQLISPIKCALPPMNLSPDCLITLAEVIQHSQDLIKNRDDHCSLVCPESFLLCRSIAEPIPSISNCRSKCRFLVDDADGKYAVSINVYNTAIDLPGSNFPYLSAIVPIGTILAIHSPAFQLRDHDEIAEIHCTNPAYFEIVPSDHRVLNGISFKVPILAPQLELNKIGVKHFVAKNYQLAIDYFSQAIKNGTGNYANRSAAYLAIGRPDLALKDAEKGLAIERRKKTPKLLLRKAKSLFLLKRYRDCLDFIQNNPLTREENATLPEYASVERWARQAFQETTTGCYNWLELRNEGVRWPYLDKHGDFLANNLIEVHTLGIKNLPLHKLIQLEKDSHLNFFITARKMIEPGSTLMALRAAAYCPTSEPVFNDQDGIVVHNAKLQLLSMFVVKASICPPESFDDNCRHLLGPLLLENAADLSQFTMNAVNARGQIVGCGIWSLPTSHFVHSCVDPNCLATFAGDFVIIRAIKTIKVGEKLSLNFTTPMASFPTRLDALLSNYGMNQSCQCRLCCFENINANNHYLDFNAITEAYGCCQDVMSILQDHDELHIDACNDLIDKLYGLLNYFRQLNRDEWNDENFAFNLVIARVKEVLAMLYDRKLNHEKAIALMECVVGVYEDVGLLPLAVLCSDYLAYWYGKVNNREALEKSIKWQERRSLTARLIYGDERFVMRRFDP